MLGAVVVAPQASHGTIRRTDGKQVAIDMCVATPGIVAGQKQATVQVEEHRAMPHWPVAIRVRSRTEAAPAFVLPEAGGTERVHAPHMAHDQ